MTADKQDSTHQFTLTGLGDAPFTVVAAGHPRARENLSFACEHCGIMLKNRHFVQSACGKVSVVGIDCLSKTGDGGLISGARALQRQERFQAKEEQRMQAQSQREEVERSLCDGLTYDEWEANQILEMKKHESSAYADVLNMPLSKHLQSAGDFGKTMIWRASAGESYSPGMKSTIKQILAKKISGKRKNSKEYLAAIPETLEYIETLENISKSVCDIQVKTREYCSKKRMETQDKINKL